MHKISVQPLTTMFSTFYLLHAPLSCWFIALQPVNFIYTKELTVDNTYWSPGWGYVMDDHGPPPHLFVHIILSFVLISTSLARLAHSATQACTLCHLSRRTPAWWAHSATRLARSTRPLIDQGFLFRYIRRVAGIKQIQIQIEPEHSCCWDLKSCNWVELPCMRGGS